MKTRAALLIAALPILLAGCSSSGGGSVTEDATPPVKLEPISGTQLNRVVLSHEAVTRLGIQTQPVTVAGGGERVPFAAVIYDPEGRSWVYTTGGADTFYRTPIVVDTISGDVATLKSGPPKGSAVVTVGAPELLGAEYGVGEE